MIKGWIRFNESSGNFTYEMAQEIIFYFSEGSEPNKDLEKDLWEHPEMGDDADSFVAYEAGSEDYEIMIKKLIGFTNTKSLTFKDDMINLYHKIREERSAFPEICEIEDVFLDLIENSGFGFLVDAKEYSYKIKLYKDGSTMSEFISYCQLLEKKINRLETPTIKAILKSCQFNDSDPYGTNLWMEVLLKKKS